MKLSFPFNSVNHDRRYKAEHWAAYFASFISTGIFPNPSTNLQVIANGDLTVTVKSGKAWIEGRFFSEEDIALTLDNPDGVLNRIDRVVVRCDYIERNILITVKKGVYSQSPALPVLQRDADAYELALADITVGKGVVNIQQSHIDDLRLNSDLCGYSVGIIKQVDTTTLYDQIKDDLANFRAEEKAEFIAWFEEIKDTLDESTAGNLLNLINEVKENTYTKSESDTTRTYTLTHTKGDTVHTLTGLPTINGIFQCQFKAAADYAEGDTFTDYTAKPIGEDTMLPDKTFITGDLVSLVVDTESKKLGFKLGGGGIIDTLPSLPVFSLTPKATSVIINFTELSSEDYPHLKDYVFVYKTGSFPQRFKDGKAIMLPKEQSGLERSFEVTNLVAKETYYFRVFTRNAKKQVQTMVIDAFQNIKVGYEEPYTLTPLTVARSKSTSSPLARGVGVFGGLPFGYGSTSYSVDIAEYYDTHKVINLLTPLSAPRCWHVSEVLNDGVIIFGGEVIGKDKKTVDYYDRAKIRSNLTPLSVARGHAPSSLLARYAVIFGGDEGGFMKPVASVDCYDSAKVRSSLPNLSTARWYSTACPIADGAGVFGGCNSTKNILSNADYYDRNKIRSNLPSLSLAVEECCSCSLSNGALVTSGFTAISGVYSDTTEYYSSNRIRSMLAPLATPRTRATAISLSDGAMICGGSSLKVVDFYDSNKVKTVLPDMSNSRWEATASPFDDGVGIFGGTKDNTVDFYPKGVLIPKE